MIKSFLEHLFEKAEYAAQDGESAVVHHASPSDFDQFKPLSHFGTANAARARAVSVGQSPEEKKHLYSARLKLGKTVRIGDSLRNHKAMDIALSLHQAGHMNHKGYTGMRDKMKTMEEPERQKHLVSYLKKRKIDTIQYRNGVEDPGSTSYIITHPKQVRLLRKSEAPINVKRGEAKLKEDVNRHE